MAQSEEGEFPKVINGAVYDDQQSYEDKIQQDAWALASLIYDIWKEKKFENSESRVPTDSQNP